MNYGNFVDGESQNSANIEELALNMEEADSRIIPHVHWHLAFEQF